jgi:hypothetical protein
MSSAGIQKLDHSLRSASLFEDPADGGMLTCFLPTREFNLEPFQLISKADDFQYESAFSSEVKCRLQCYSVLPKTETDRP